MKSMKRICEVKFFSWSLHVHLCFSDSYKKKACNMHKSNLVFFGLVLRCVQSFFTVWQHSIFFSLLILREKITTWKNMTVQSTRYGLKLCYYLLLWANNKNSHKTFYWHLWKTELILVAFLFRPVLLIRTKNYKGNSWTVLQSFWNSFCNFRSNIPIKFKKNSSLGQIQEVSFPFCCLMQPQLVCFQALSTTRPFWPFS